MMKKLVVGVLLTLGIIGSVSALPQDPIDPPAPSSDGVLKYSHSLVYLKCISASCNGFVSNWHSMKVHYKFIPDVPPHSESRLYWNNNVPADIAAGTSVAHTLGDTCPDGSRMTAEWYLDGNFKPVTAKSIDCDGVEHFFSVHEFNF